MAITQPSKRSKADAFAAAAPDASRRRNCVGSGSRSRSPCRLTLIAEIDAVAAEEDRSRAKMIEIGMRQFVQSYNRRAAA